MVGVDSSKRICVAFVGRPDDRTYADCCSTAYALMEQAGKKAGLVEHVEPHRRGHFAALNVGATHGKGTMRPLNLNNKQYAPLVKELLATPELRRIASFASCEPRPSPH